MLNLHIEIEQIIIRILLAALIAGASGGIGRRRIVRRESKYTCSWLSEPRLWR